MHKIIKGNILSMEIHRFLIYSKQTNKKPTNHELIFSLPSKCNQKHSDLYLVKRTCRYQTSGLYPSLQLLSALVSRSSSSPHMSLLRQPSRKDSSHRQPAATCCSITPSCKLLGPSKYNTQFKQTPCCPLFGKVF